MSRTGAASPWGGPVVGVAGGRRVSMVFPDSFSSYSKVRYHFEHGMADHKLGQCVDGIMHTNGIENFWALLKRSIQGTSISVATEHVLRYVGERVFAFNNCKDNDFGRFQLALDGMVGRLITYAELTSKQWQTKNDPKNLKTSRI